MLIKDLFKLSEIESKDGKLTSAVTFNAAHKIFAGHFPGNPVTPGVIQIQVVKEILEKFYGKELKLETMSRCKFLKLLNPNETPCVTVELSFAENPLHVSAIGMKGEAIYFKLNAVFSDGLATN